MKLIALSLLTALALPAQTGLRAGLARVNITPPNGYAMGGWPERTRGASGTHDPLYATVLLLESGDASLALVACDLEAFVSTRIAAQAKQKFGVGYTILAMSGTHSGPSAADPRSHWHTATEDKIVDAIGEARAALFPAEIRVAAGRAYLAFNRRKVSEGRAHMWWRNPDGMPSHPLDPTVNVITIHEAAKLRAVVVNYAARASLLGPSNTEFSADYPGALRHYLESQAAGAMCLFLQGASGDISPNREREPGKAPAFAAADSMGSALAAEAVRLVPLAKPLPDPTQPLRVAANVIEIPNRWQPETRMPIGITAATVGGGLCFLAVPGEPFIEHQVTFRARSECVMPVLLGSAYSGSGIWAGMMPTIQAAAEGGDGASYNTSLAVGAGEMLIDRGVIELMRLRGLLLDLPDPRF